MLLRRALEAISPERGLKVIVYLNHFTLPLVEFAKYAAFLAWKLGDKVDMWTTV